MQWGQNKMMGEQRKSETPSETDARLKREVNASSTQTSRTDASKQNSSNTPKSEK